jgi:hypothetical protein
MCNILRELHFIGKNNEAPIHQKIEIERSWVSNF